jgi:integrase
VLEMPLENVRATRSRKEAHIPVVLTREEVKQVLTLLDGLQKLVVKLLYGCGFGINEAVRLRVHNRLRIQIVSDTRRQRQKRQ